MCNKIITHDTYNYKSERRINIGYNIMPVIAAVGAIVIIAVYLIVKGMERKAQYSGFGQEKFNRFVEEIKRENAEIRKDLLTVRAKVEAIDKMMEEI